jgi:hypothetical protein
MNRLVLHFWAGIFCYVLKIVRSAVGIATSRRGLGEGRSLCALLYGDLFFAGKSTNICFFTFVLSFHLTTCPTRKSSSNFMQFFFCIHCFFLFFLCMLDLCVSSPSSLCPLEWLSPKIKWVTTKLTGYLNTWIWK